MMPGTRELIGRRAELSLLDDELAAAGRAELRVVLVSAEPGMGKTALVRNSAELAGKRGVEILVAECAREDAMRPLAPLQQLSVFADVAVAGEIPGRSIDEIERHRLFSSIARRLRDRAGQRPVMLVVEDAQWADAETLGLMPYLARRIPDVALLVILTFRSDAAATDPLARVVAELRQRGATTVHLPALTRGQVALLVRRMTGMLPAEEVADFIADRSAGNPLFVEELTSALAESRLATLSDGLWTATRSLHDVVLPTTVTATVRARLDVLPVEARGILSSAALIGQRFAVDLLIEVAGATPGSALAALRAGIEARLIDEEVSDADAYAFRHALLRDALIEHLLAPERRELHRAVALALERRTPEVELASVAEALAYHYEAAGIADRAVRYHMMVVRTTRHGAELGYLFSMMNNNGVARHLGRALTLAAKDDPDRAEMLRLFAWSQPDPALRIPLLEESLEHARRLGDAHGEALAMVMLGVWRGLQGDRGAISVIREGLARLERVGSPAEIAEATHQLARVAMLAMDRDAVPLAQRAVEVARSAGADILLANAQITLGGALSDREEGIALTRTGIRIARERSARLVESRGLINLWNGTLVWAAWLPESARIHELDDIEAEVVRAIDMAGGSMSANQFEARLLHMFFGGRWDDVLALIDEMAFHPFSDSYVGALIGAHIRVARGGLANETAAVRRAHEQVAGSLPPNRLVLAPEIFYIAGRPDEALAAASILRDEGLRASRAPYRHVALLHDNTATVVALAAARELADPAVFGDWLDFARSADLSATVTAQGRIEYVRAECALREGRPEEALRAFARSAEAFERRGATLLARTLPRLRRAELLAPSDLVAAQKELSAVIAMWRAVGATWYLGRLRAWADAHGLRGWTVSARRGPHLTPRELEVARRVAEGLTNKEIAGALGITERTAETHVQRILTKLDLRGRAQLAAWFAGSSGGPGTRT